MNLLNRAGFPAICAASELGCERLGNFRRDPQRAGFEGLRREPAVLKAHNCVREQPRNHRNRIEERAFERCAQPAAKSDRELSLQQDVTTIQLRSHLMDR